MQTTIVIQIINAIQIISAMLIINAIQSVFHFLFSVMLNIRSILFFMADWDTRPCLYWTLKMGQCTMLSSIWVSLGSLFLVFTKLNALLNSSSCSSFHLNRPVNTFFFFASEKNRMKLLLVIYKKFLQQNLINAQGYSTLVCPLVSTHEL